MWCMFSIIYHSCEWPVVLSSLPYERGAAYYIPPTYHNHSCSPYHVWPTELTYTYKYNIPTSNNWYSVHSVLLLLIKGPPKHHLADEVKGCRRFVVKCNTKISRQPLVTICRVKIHLNTIWQMKSKAAKDLLWNILFCQEKKYMKYLTLLLQWDRTIWQKNSRYLFYLCR